MKFKCEFYDIRFFVSQGFLKENNCQRGGEGERLFSIQVLYSFSFEYLFVKLNIYMYKIED